MSRKITFEDNQLLAQLFGEHDRHLARIEQSLGVTISSRGNQVAIQGFDEQVTGRAAEVLQALYERLEKGLIVSLDEVDAALRMATQNDEGASMQSLTNMKTAVRTRQKTITPRTPRQGEYIEQLRRHDLVLGLGPAGTGKTFLAVAVAVSMMLEGKIERIILSRPAVEAGERLGFLPGDLKEKIDPYLRPLYDALYDTLPAEQVIKKLSVGEIEIAPLAFMRGRTLSNSFIILDEAQNTTPVQMKMFLTRLGENSRMVLTGDISQVDLPRGVRSGLRDAVEVCRGLPGVGITEFSETDVVRHPLVSHIVAAYKRFDETHGTSEAYK